ncbi:NAD(P)/FAD-dependent oxidoreductase [Thalassovita mediterranea]|jgi:glycine/D-amino acid oxidase-like deaminating enzyme|uniref:Gamma-glutamylputrescine oxidoreductase n=1 Tax=Thalassovita mediterranea TaxID=340021 RepID=A0A0P1H3D8_9RHOB|nr:FAD-binding oxidoreductase [Thalassovita mediterranea]CUH83297.1 Gamma-glutamylputrescine oxidoreductase [Thalassovita mediterranea]SIS33880.1 Glycine/D-amino acid oxidase [Thalassovita mediterranea]
MTRIYEDMAYSDRPIRDRYWDSTLEDTLPIYPALQGAASCDFAIVGGGYTGLSAALRLIESGASVILLDAKRPGWGASGRNGGLVSIGTSKLTDDQIEATFGTTEARSFFEAERCAVDLVEGYIDRYDLSIDRHSQGYSCLAHSPASLDDLKIYGESYQRRYGLPYQLIQADQMAAQGLASPEFHGGVHLPVGFALNPLKFLDGLTRAASDAGVQMHSDTPVLEVRQQNGFHLKTPEGVVTARKVLFATNGYGSDHLPRPLGAHYLPVQSNILVSRPMTEEELQAQGWTSRQMIVDSRTLLHYFRLLPDNRMLLGLRGSVRVSEDNITRTRARARADFDRMFPAWRHVETPYFWSGLICMTRALVPFAGPVPGMDGAFASFGYHGSGVTGAPYGGALIADLALGRQKMPHPTFMKAPPRRFELGRFRRASLPPAFAWYRLKDALS